MVVVATDTHAGEVVVEHLLSSQEVMVTKVVVSEETDVVETSTPVEEAPVLVVVFDVAEVVLVVADVDELEAVKSTVTVVITTLPEPPLASATAVMVYFTYVCKALLLPRTGNHKSKVCEAEASLVEPL